MWPTDEAGVCGMATGQDGIRLIHRVELEDWFSRAGRTWNPIVAAGRQFDALTCENNDVPGLDAYDHLCEVANLALQWLEDNPCPDKVVGTRFKAQMMAYRAVADTVRSTITEEDGDQMVAQLSHLRDVVDKHTDAIDETLRPRPRLGPEDRGEPASVEQYRRRVPRQPAYWDGNCRVEGESSAGWRECRVIDISMFGIGITLHHPVPSQLVGRRIAIDVPAVGDSVSIRLEGEIRNAGSTMGGVVRVGVEFEGLAQSERGTLHHRVAATNG